MLVPFFGSFLSTLDFVNSSLSFLVPVFLIFVLSFSFSHQIPSSFPSSQVAGSDGLIDYDNTTARPIVIVNMTTEVIEIRCSWSSGASVWQAGSVSTYPTVRRLLLVHSLGRWEL